MSLDFTPKTSKIHGITLSGGDNKRMSIPKINKIKIETLPPMIVGCCRVTSHNPEHDSIDILRDWLIKQNLMNSTVRIFGFDVESSSISMQDGKRTYETWAPIPADIQSSNGIEIKEFKGGLYATILLYKPFDDQFIKIPLGWKILHEWVIQNERYLGGQHQWLEEVLIKEQGDDLKLYHTVRARFSIS